MCLFKEHIIGLVALLKLEPPRDNYPFLRKLNSFCIEKAGRCRINSKLREFCDGHPNLSFTTAKKLFGALESRYWFLL